MKLKFSEQLARSYSSKSYAGKYEIFYLPNGWKTLACDGKLIGSARIKGGVYTLAKYFDK